MTDGFILSQGKRFAMVALGDHDETFQTEGSLGTASSHVIYREPHQSSPETRFHGVDLAVNINSIGQHSRGVLVVS